MKKVIVIGGGAAGMAAAYAASFHVADVLLLERNEKLGKKIYITGKGRGNLTNAADIGDFFEHIVSNPKFLYSALYGFTNEQLLELLKSYGLVTKTERAKRVFPASDHASDITAAWRKALQARGVKVRLNCGVKELLTKDVLALPDVKERVDMYFEQQALFKEQLKRITKIVGKVAVIDLREETTIYAGNRFMVYAMYPETELSVHVAWGFRKQNTAVMIGKSIINKSSKFNIGELCLSYGGGGHANAGTCQLDNDKVDAELPVIFDKLNGKIPV